MESLEEATGALQQALDDVKTAVEAAETYAVEANADGVISDAEAAELQRLTDAVEAELKTAESLKNDFDNAVDAADNAIAEAEAIYSKIQSAKENGEYDEPERGRVDPSPPEDFSESEAEEWRQRVENGENPDDVANDIRSRGDGGSSELPSVNKAVNSNIQHAAQQGASLERGVFSSVEEGLKMLRELSDEISSSGWPEGTIRDTTRSDSFLVPVGNNGYAVYRLNSNGTARLRTVLVAD